MEDGALGLETALNLYLRRIARAESRAPGLNPKTLTLSSTLYLSGVDKGERGSSATPFSNLSSLEHFTEQKGD